jgi:hypothetical protein
MRWLGLTIGLLLFAAITSQLPLRDTDVIVYSKAAERVFDQGIDPYPRRAGEQLPFTYPPTALFMFYPLADLTLAQATGLLGAVNVILVPVVMVLIVGDLARAGPSTAAGRRLLLWGPVYIGCYGGLYLNLIFCQINAILLLLLWGFWRQVRLGRQGVAAGAALVLGSVAKPHVGLLLLAAGPRPDRRLVGGVVAAGLVVLLIAWSVAPAGSWGSWLTLVPGASSYQALPDGHSSIAAPWNRSVAGSVARLLVPNKFTTVWLDAPGLAQGLSTTIVLLLLGVTGRALFRSMRRGERPASDRDGEMSLVLLWVFFAAAALVLLRDRVLDRGVGLSSRMTAGLVLLVIAATFDDLVPLQLRTASQPLMALMSVGLLSLWLLLVQSLARRSAPGSISNERQAPGS